jgi:hypothetical protein
LDGGLVTVKAKVFYSLIGGWRIKVIINNSYHWIMPQNPNDWRTTYDQALMVVRARIAHEACYCNPPERFCLPCLCWELTRELDG